MKERTISYKFRKLCAVFIIAVASIVLAISLFIAIAVPTYLESLKTQAPQEEGFEWIGAIVVADALSMGYYVYLSGYCVFGLLLSLGGVLISPSKPMKIISIILAVVFAVGSIFAIKVRIESGMSYI